MEKCGVYQVWCNRSGKFYVGSSKRIYNRWAQHRSKLRKGKSPCLRLQQAWNKHGEEAFRFSILEECAEDELEKREQFYINTLAPEYNSITNVEERYGKEMWAKRAAALRARALARTHCPHGHLYDEANTYFGKKGEKICRTCNADRVKAIWRSMSPEKREAALAYRNEYYRKNHDALRVKQKEYTAAHREKKREYDKAHRAEQTARKRLARQNETPEQRERRLRMKRESARRCRERLMDQVG